VVPTAPNGPTLTLLLLTAYHLWELSKRECQLSEWCPHVVRHGMGGDVNTIVDLPALSYVCGAPVSMGACVSATRVRRGGGALQISTYRVEAPFNKLFPLDWMLPPDAAALPSAPRSDVALLTSSLCFSKVTVCQTSSAQLEYVCKRQDFRVCYC